MAKSIINCSSIYTKTGDNGKTQYHGERIYKNDPKMHILGTIDELNSFIGLTNANVKSTIIKHQLKHIQCELIDLGSYCSGYSNLYPNPNKLEDWIDKIDSTLEPLKHFIIPVPEYEDEGYTHVCRSVTRRLERWMVEEVDTVGDALPYVNRLSDYFFILARYLCVKEVYVKTVNGKHQIS